MPLNLIWSAVKLGDGTTHSLIHTFVGAAGHAGAHAGDKGLFAAVIADLSDIILLNVFCIVK